MASETERRRRAGVAILAALGLLLQAPSGLLPSTVSAAAAPSPLGALVICTPDGIRILGPDGVPVEVPKGDAPAMAVDPCQACCLSMSCCPGLTSQTASLGFAPDAAASFARLAPGSPHRLFLLAKPGRGPPPVRTSRQTH